MKSCNDCCHMQAGLVLNKCVHPDSAVPITDYQEGAERLIQPSTQIARSFGPCGGMAQLWEARDTAGKYSMDEVDHLLAQISRKTATMEHRVVRANKTMANAFHCNFCGKSQAEVAKLIAGPGPIFICNGCVDLCHDIMHKDDPLGEIGFGEA